MICALGIDPGVTGSLAILSGRTTLCTPFLDIYDFIGVSASAKLISRLNEEFSIKFVILEKVWFSDKEWDVKTAEVLIRNSEMWEVFLKINKIPYERYAPKTWRKGLVSSKKQKNKKTYVEKAQKMWPDQKFKRHDQAEAALMAYRAWCHIQAGWKTEKRAG